MSNSSTSEAEVRHNHFIIYKPFGVLSQFVNNKTRKKRLLSNLHDFPENTMAIGRLDVDSEGLLFLTTDGKVSAVLRGKLKIEKEYLVQVDGIITQDAIEKMKSGVEIGIKGKKHQTIPCQAKLANAPDYLSERGRAIRDERHGPTSWATITLTEGKFRQVRKMTAAVGFPTLRLIRIRIGDIHLENREIGSVEEVEWFKV